VRRIPTKRSSDRERRFSYFADGNQALIRVPATGEGDLADWPGERNWGRGEWFARSPGCGNWVDQLAIPGRYQQVSAEEVPAIADHIDTMPGGAFRDRWRFWEDQAHQWTLERARKRAAKLDAEVGPDSSHWTVREYFDDVRELERLRAFITRHG
jgi:hypothetical protein